MNGTNFIVCGRLRGAPVTHTLPENVTRSLQQIHMGKHVFFNNLNIGLIPIIYPNGVR